MTLSKVLEERDSGDKLGQEILGASEEKEQSKGPGRRVKSRHVEGKERRGLAWDTGANNILCIRRAQRSAKPNAVLFLETWREDRIRGYSLV